MKTKMVRVDALTGRALDWAVARSLGFEAGDFNGTRSLLPAFSTSWLVTGPLIDANPSALPYRSHARRHLGRFEAQTPSGFQHNGDTILIAFCRTLVAEKLGCDVAVPVELLEGQS